MNEQIISNLYQFWEEIGSLTTQFSKSEHYSVVMMVDSDWPNRIFNIKTDTQAFDLALQLSREDKLPDMVTVTNTNVMLGNPNFEFVFGQQNMALDLKSITMKWSLNLNIKRVKTEKEAIAFAATASEAFGSRVDARVIYLLASESKNIQLFVYQEKGETFGSGIIFFDSNNNAGLHMIGTAPNGRGKGIGRSMTERLLIEAKDKDVSSCVLHASLMGEPIYRKLGFESYGEIETYRVLKNNGS